MGERRDCHGVTEGEHSPSSVVSLGHIGRAVAPVAERVTVAVVDGAAHRDARSCAVLRHVRVVGAEEALKMSKGEG